MKVYILGSLTWDGFILHQDDSKVFADRDIAYAALFKRKIEEPDAYIMEFDVI